MYPVGSYYLSDDSTSPASLFGGEWEQIKDRFLIGAGGSYAIKTEGGNTSKWGGTCPRVNLDASRSWTGSTSIEGSSEAFSILNPYRAIYMWRRTA